MGQKGAGGNPGAIAKSGGDPKAAGGSKAGGKHGGGKAGGGSGKGGAGGKM